MSVKQEGLRIIEETNYDSGTLTIEKRLHLYESHPDKSARSAVMWHAWNQNKAWLSRLLELTLASFPSYSRHDASHAEAVLHNIERILGESRIQEISATDCFAILHTVYIHDIGMSILAADRREIVKSDGFIEMIDDLVEGVDSDLRDAALQLKKWCYDDQSVDQNEDKEGLEYHRRKGGLYEEKLETYYAIVYLIANYQRRYHGEKVASSVRDWLSKPGELGAEFAMSGIPMRIFLRIADCARLHTDWEFDHIMELPQEEDGYEKDMMHPRFVAVLLQLLRVLKEMASRTYRKAESEDECSFSDKTEEIFKRLLRANPEDSTDPQARSKPQEWKRMLLGISLFYNFYTREVTSEHREFTPKSLKEEREEWERALQKVSLLARNEYLLLKETGNRIQLTDIFWVTETYIDYKERDFRIWLCTNEDKWCELLCTDIIWQAGWNSSKERKGRQTGKWKIRGTFLTARKSVKTAENLPRCTWSWH